MTVEDAPSTPSRTHGRNNGTGHAARAGGLRRPSDWLPPLLVAAGAFVFRFLTTGMLENDHFVALSRAHQVLHGDWPVRDFSDPGMPLTYLPAAAAAAVFGPTLLTDVIWSLALLATATAVIFVIARRASGSTLVAITAVGITLLALPRLYNAPKVLVHVGAIGLAWRYADVPTRGRLLALSCWTAMAFLVRHDHAVYIAAAAAMMLVLRHVQRPALAVMRVVEYAGTALLFVLPWLAYVEWHQGLAEYLASAFQFADAEARRTVDGWPAFPPGPVFSLGRLEVVGFYAIMVLPAVAIALAARGALRVSAAHAVFAAALVLLTSLAFLRDVLSVRWPDVVGPVAVLAATVAPGLPRQRTVRLVVAVVLVAAVTGFGLRLVRRGVPSPVQAAHLLANRVTHLRQPSTIDSPEAVVAAYISRCSLPDERVLVFGFGPEVPVMAGRAFAGGIPAWLPGYYESDADVRRGLERLQRERVAVVVLVDGTEPAGSWPVLAAWIASHDFSEARMMPGRRRIAVQASAALTRAGTDPATGLPCRRVS